MASRPTLSQEDPASPSAVTPKRDFIRSIKFWRILALLAILFLLPLAFIPGWRVHMRALILGGVRLSPTASAQPKLGDSMILRLPGRVNLDLLYCPAGTFLMGSRDELGRSDDEKLHQVTLTKGFYLGKYEVTKEQYQALMGIKYHTCLGGQKRPVNRISWEEADDYCKKLNDLLEGQLLKGYEFALPSEAQWEYACRAGTVTALNNGQDLTTDKAACENLDQVAWYYFNAQANRDSSADYGPEFLQKASPFDGSRSQAVGLKLPNAWGLYDMHGNVSEWCRDYYYADYGGTSIDPLAINPVPTHARRGGTCFSRPSICRSASRGGAKLSYNDEFLGFRLALVPKPKHAPLPIEGLLLGNVKEPISPSAPARDGQNITLNLGRGIKLPLIYCKPGSFMMGSPQSEVAHDERETLHKVTLSSGYYLGQFELTQEQYLALCGLNPSKFNSDKRCPLEYVSWDEVYNLCCELNKSVLVKQLPKGYAFALPSEAQWEYACRAGTTSELNNGRHLTKAKGASPTLDELAWYKVNGANKTHPVGEKQPNAWGFYDMHGNVSEYCFDSTKEYEGPSTDPLAFESGYLCIVRGGSWLDSPGACRSADRNGICHEDYASFVGFRLAAVAEKQAIRCGLKKP